MVMRNITRLLFFAVAWAWIISPVNAQSVAGGAWMLGGTAGFSSTKFETSDNASTIVNLSPSVAAYVIDDLGVGLGLSYLWVKVGGESESTTSISPFARYYFLRNVFAQAGVDIGLGKEGGFAIDVAIGYSWFLGRSVAVEPQFYYENFNQKGDVGDFSTFGLAIGLQAFLGR